MEAWFNHKLTVSKDFKRAPEDIPPFQFTKFVLVHKDISPRNIILDIAGRVWLLDWGHAGAYPSAFERAAITEQYRFPEFNKMLLEVLPASEPEARQLWSIGFVLANAFFA